MKSSPIKNVLLLLTTILSSCSLVPDRPPLPAHHDFGPPPQHAQTVALETAERLLLNGFNAPQWLETNNIQYRLLYDDPTRLRAYAYHQWLAPPTRLMEQRWQEQAATRSNKTTTNTSLSAYRLKVELIRFEQLFDSHDSARVVIGARATIMRPDQSRPLMERIFAGQLKSSPDVRGAIEGLASLTDTLIADIRQWAHQASAHENLLPVKLPTIRTQAAQGSGFDSNGEEKYELTLPNTLIQ